MITFLRGLDRAAPYDFNDALEKAGYDLIYIDFTENLDDIRRNAALFEQVLRWANDQKRLAGSTEPNVVMGMSMGGLIGRYGLARLVRNGYDPQTRLLVLHDSPQRGAINPMGLQALSRQADFPVAILPGNGQGQNGQSVVHTSDLSDKLTEALAILDAPATRQLSIKRVTGIDNEYEDNTFIDGPYKDMVSFTSAGGPPATFPLIVATSDGSQCGRPQNTPAYQELTRDNRNWILGASYIVRLGIQSEAVANALPAYGTQDRIAHLRVWVTIRVLWAKLNVTLLNRNYTSPANTLPYETLPGGSTNLNEQQDLTTNHDNGFLGFWRFSDNTTLYNGDICFAPTFSTLDVPTVTPATAYAKYVNNVTDNPSPPRVASYIAQEQSGTQFNLTHLRFTARNSEWIYDQMEDPSKAAAVACSAECLQPITGPSQVCSSPASVFQINSADATWTATPSSFFVATTGSGSQFSTSAASGARGTGTITVTLPCGLSATRTVSVGPAEPTGTYFYNGTHPLQTTNLIPSPTRINMALNGSSSFVFTSSSSAIPVTSFDGSTAYFDLPANTGVTITATAPNSTCGLVGRFAFVPGGARYAFAPNPANTELTVTATDAGPAALTEPFDADLYDNFGKKVKTKKSDKGKAVIDVRDLPEGLYDLRAGKGKDALSEHVQITH